MKQALIYFFFLTGVGRGNEQLMSIDQANPKKVHFTSKAGLPNSLPTLLCWCKDGLAEELDWLPAQKKKANLISGD